MNIMIIEDEPANERHLRNILKTVLPDAFIIASTSSVKSSVEFLLGTDILPDIIFADIQLADGLCFSIFEKTDINIPVIFTTVYDKYAMNAFECNGAAYILKPVMEKDIKQVMDRLLSLAPLSRSCISALGDCVTDRNSPYPKRIIIEHGTDLLPVCISDIVLIETEFRGTKIFTSDGRWGISRYPLKFFETNLDSPGFFKISRRQIISTDKIMALRKNTPNVYEKAPWRDGKPIAFLVRTPRALDVLLKTIACYMLYTGVITIAEMIFREDFHALVTAATLAIPSGIYIAVRR